MCATSSRRRTPTSSWPSALESPLTPGGAGLRDWVVTDANIRLRAPKGGEAEWTALGANARFHTGFFDEIVAIQQRMREEVQRRVQEQQRPIWVTGHSLGGALAHLAAWHLYDQGDNLDIKRVVTFAAPMAVDFNAADSYDRYLRPRLFRFVNVSDPIPSVPILDLLNNPYRHVGQRIDLPAEDQAPAAADDLFGHFRAIATHLAGDLGKPALRAFLSDFIANRINAHLLVKGYISALRPGAGPMATMFPDTTSFSIRPQPTAYPFRRISQLAVVRRALSKGIAHEFL